VTGDPTPNVTLWLRANGHLVAHSIQEQQRIVGVVVLATAYQAMDNRY
jgi:hypothetical protein